MITNGGSSWRRRTRMAARRAILAAGAAVFTCQAVPPTFAAQVADEAKKTVWAGAYSTEQANRGKVAYRVNCATCHREDMSGSDNAPGLATPEYIRSWNGRSVNELFTLISTFMPLDTPGSLDKKTYLDITALVLQANHFPAGSQDLPSDEASLQQIGIGPEQK